MRVFSFWAAITIALLAASAAPALAQSIYDPNYNVIVTERINSHDPTAPGPNSNGDARNSRLSADVEKLLLLAKKQMNAGQWLDAVAALEKAQTAVRGNYDQLKIDQLLTNLNLSLKNPEDADAAAEAAAEIPNIPAQDRVDVYASAAALAFNAGHSDKAVKYATALRALNPKDDDSKDIVARILAPAGTASAGK